MVQEQRIVSMGCATRLKIVDDDGSPILEYLKDRVGPLQETPNILFCTNTLVIYWHSVSPAIEHGQLGHPLSSWQMRSFPLGARLRSVSASCSRARSIWSTARTSLAELLGNLDEAFAG